MSNHARTAHAIVRAISTGRAVSEFEPRGKAAGEIEVLWKWICSILEAK